MRKSVLLIASMALAVLLACGVAMVEAVEPAQAAFPGTNGKIVFGETDPQQNAGYDSLKSINPSGLGLITLERFPSPNGFFSDPAVAPDGTRVAYAAFGLNSDWPDYDSEIYSTNIAT